LVCSAIEEAFGLLRLEKLCATIYLLLGFFLFRYLKLHTQSGVTVAIGVSFVEGISGMYGSLKGLIDVFHRLIMNPLFSFFWKQNKVVITISFFKIR
jgi:hypothetical protein